MADRKAYRLLRGDAYDARETLAQHVRRVGLVVAEGTPDWLTVQLAERTRRGDDARAVIGVFSGAWTSEHAGKVPDGTTVTIATDLDHQGNKYAHAIAESFRGRCILRRWSPKARAA